MAKELFDMYTNPDVEILEKFITLVNPDISKVFTTHTLNMNIHQAKLNKHIDVLYSNYEEEFSNAARAEPISSSFRGLIKEGNDIMGLFIKDLIKTCNLLNFQVSLLRNKLERFLGDQNLMSIYTPNNLIQSLLNYGTHYLAFEVGMPKNPHITFTVPPSPGLEGQCAFRDYGEPLRELSYKISNDIFCRINLLRDELGKAIKTEMTNDILENMTHEIFMLWVACGVYWEIQGASSMYIYSKIYEKF